MRYVSSLSQWDDPSWHSETDYSKAAARVIKAGYHALTHGSRQRASFLKTFNALLGLTSVPLSLHQREHVYYLLSACQAADGNYEDALAYADEAIQLARGLDELGDITDMLILRASVKRAVSLFVEAAADLYDCMAIWDSYAKQMGTTISHSVDPDRHLQVLAQLATYEYSLGHFDTAHETIMHARALLPLPDSEAHLANLDWVESLLYRVQRKPYLAFLSAKDACGYYERSAHPSTLVRLYFLMAESVMDVAETLPAGSFRDGIIRGDSITRLQLGRVIARNAGDHVGGGLLQLATMRAQRLLRQGEDREAQIEAVIHLAREFGDETLLNQAYMALGNELAWQCRYAEALSCYRDAVRVLDGAGAVALKLPALLMIQKMEALLATQS